MSESASAPSAPPEPSATPSSNTVKATAPTLGAVLGSALGAYVASKVGGNDPLIGNTITAAVTGLVTALFHWAGSKLGLALTV